MALSKLKPPDATAGSEELSIRLAKPDALAVAGLYSLDKSGSFLLDYSETGVPYGATAPATVFAQTSLTLPSPPAVVANVTLELAPLVVGGINYAGKWRVESGSFTSDILLPGLLTYDIAGRSGDPHASERVGAGCAKQALLFAQAVLAAAVHGASAAQLDALYGCMKPVIDQLHGRHALNLWVVEQIKAAVVERRTPPSYAEFVRARLAAGVECFDGVEHAHSRAFLASADSTLPEAFYRKVGLIK